MKTHSINNNTAGDLTDLTDWEALGAESVVQKLKEFCFSQ